MMQFGHGAEGWTHLSDQDGEHVAIFRATDGQKRAEASVVFNSNYRGRHAYRVARSSD